MNNKTNIEEDIKEINVIITTIRKILGKNIKITDEDVYKIDGRQYIAIENILKELERLKQENVKINTANQIYINLIQSMALVISQEYIPKQEIKDKIEEMDSCIELQKIIKEEENNDNPKKYYFAREVLQELLE